MDIMVVINQMMMLFIIMMIGYAAVKLHLVDMDFQKKLSGFILQVTMPFLMISSVSGTDRSGAGETVLVTFVVAGLSYLITPLLGYLTARLLRVPRDQVRIYIFLTMFSNIAFMGFPVIHAIFGKQAMVIAIIFNLFFNVLQFTIGTSLFSGEKMKLDLNTFRSPAVIASILAIIMFVFGIELPPHCKVRSSHWAELPHRWPCWSSASVWPAFRFARSSPSCDSILSRSSSRLLFRH